MKMCFSASDARPRVLDHNTRSVLALSRRVSIHVSAIAHCVGTAINFLCIRETTAQFRNLPILACHNIPLYCDLLCASTELQSMSKSASP